MKFAAGNYFYLMWLIVLLIGFYIYSFKKRRKNLARWGELALVSKLITNFSFKKRKVKIVFLLAGLVFSIIALTQPQWGYHWEEMRRRGIDVVIVLDTSRSMLADDAKPNRLSVAKRQIEDLLKMLPGDRIGLITFAGSSFVQCPLTLDYGAFRLFLDHVNTDLIPLRGTDVGGALKKALSVFEKGSKKHRAIILISDGEDHRGLVPGVLKQAKNMDVPIYVVGIGTKEGAPIPIEDSEGNRSYLKDKKGNTVLSKLEDINLKKIALQTGGTYASGAVALDQIYNERIAKMEKKELESTRRRIYENRYQIPLAIGLILIIIAGIMSEYKKSIN